MTGKPTDHMAVAPDWGSGVLRRAFRLRGFAGKVEAALEDMCHAMICTVEHDGEKIVAVEADFRRYTLQFCPGASVPLQALVGMPLTTTTAEFFAGGRARQNCTHMLDLAWLAMRHARRGAIEWLYEVEIPDAPKGPMRGVLRRNGETVQDWCVERGVIMSPPALAEQSLTGGFTRWLTTDSGLDEDTIEECLVLHKGYFMTGARQFLVPEGPLPESYKKSVVGVCYGYAADKVDAAIGMSGMKRDFSHHPERLLRFE